MKTDVEGNPLKIVPARIAQAIGLVVVHWSELEYLVESSLWKFARFRGDGETQWQFRVLISHMYINARLDSLLTLVNMTAAGSPLEKRIKAIDGESRKPRRGFVSRSVV
jgi:hypothetical protein